MSESIVLQKAIKFALRIVGVYKYLSNERQEFVLSKQLLLSGFFIAKHAKAAVHSNARSAFSNEMFIALQKALDTELWLLLLKESDYLSEGQYLSLNDDCIELIKMTSSISKTSKVE